MVADDQNSATTQIHLSETPLEYLICGSVGGILSTLVGHPFDTIKVRQQTMFRSQVVPTASVIVRDIITTDGILGLYKGLLAPLLSFHAIYAMSFCSYKMGKLMVGPHEHELLHWWHYFLAGTFSGLCTGLLQTPGDRVKILLQIQTHAESKKYDGAVDAIAKLYREGGIYSLYKGVGATLLKEVPANGVYFMTYEIIRDGLTDCGRERTTPGIAIFSGGLAGIIYAGFVAPLDVLKSRVQSAGMNKYPRGVRDAFIDLVQQEGFKGFSRGLGPILLRAFPANAACFVGFEFTRQNIRDRDL